MAALAVSAPVPLGLSWLHQPLHLPPLSGRIFVMRLAFMSLGVVLLVAGLLYHFAALRLFNLLVPKDAGVKRAGANLAYGAALRQRIDLYAPERPTHPLPVLLFIYGGSWDSGRKEDYAFAGHAFAAKGFLTAIADYRLVPDVHYPEFVDDTALALNWLSAHVAEFGGDPGRIFFAGHSAGAYSAVQAVLRNGLRQHVRAVASLAGPFDFLPLDSPKTIAAFGKVGDLAETQPVNADLSGAPPMLLLHGEEDATVGLHNSWNLYARAIGAGRMSELRFYKGIGHVGILLALAKPFRRRAPVRDDVVSFFQRYL